MSPRCASCGALYSEHREPHAFSPERSCPPPSLTGTFQPGYAAKDHVFEVNREYIDRSNPSRLLDWLYLSGSATALNHSLLTALGVTAVCNLTPDDFGCAEHFKYRQFAIDDAAPLDPRIIGEFLEQMQAWRETNETVLAHCLPPGIVINAPTPFETGGATENSVFDMAGDIQAVAAELKRDYDGELLTLEMAGNLPFKCTPEHPLLVIRPWRNSGGKVFKPNWRTPEQTRSGNVEPQWLKASEVRKGDFLLCPIHQAHRGTEPIVGQVLHHNAKELTEPFACPDLAWLFGLYVADGAVLNVNSLQFTLNHKTDRDRLHHAIALFGVSARIDEEENYFRATINSRSLVACFRNWFGVDCYTKRFPEFCLGWEDECLRALVEGYVAGDGTHPTSKAAGTTDAVTTSKHLAYQLWMLLVKLGQYPCISEYNNGQVTNFGPRAPTWRIWWNGRGKHHKTCYHAGYYCMPVSSITSASYTGQVYNFSIEGTESFMAGGVVTHNCHAGISRTSSFAIAWLMHEHGVDADTDLRGLWSACEDQVAGVRPIIMPHYLLKRAVLNYFDQGQL